MPQTDEIGAQLIVDEITRLSEVNNQFYTSPRLEMSAGMATAHDGQRLEETVRLADMRMYAAKRAYYSDTARERRRSQAD
jgi:GGDEF domain-containing protein